MLWFGRFRAIALMSLLAVAALALAQGTLFKDGLPKARIAIADLPDDFQAVSLRSNSDSGFGEIFSGPMGALMIFGSMGGGNAQQGQFMKVLDAAAVSFTRGETTEVQGVRFLVTYKVALDASALQTIMEKHVAPELELVLVRFDSVKSMVPKPDFTKASLLAAFAPITPAEEPTSAKRTATLSNIKQVGVATLIYMGDYDDVIPYVQDTKSAFAVLMPYTKNKEVFRSLNPNGAEFHMNMSLGGVAASAIEAPADTPLFFESNTWPDGKRAVVYVDGHAKFVDAAGWSSLQPALHLKLSRNGKPLPPDYWRRLRFDDGASSYSEAPYPGGASTAAPTVAPPPPLPPPVVAADRSVHYRVSQSRRQIKAHRRLVHRRKKRLK